jgi:hypothetical protein
MHTAHTRPHTIVVAAGLSRAVYENLLLQKSADLRSVDAQAPDEFKSAAEEAKCSAIALEALLVATYSLSDDAPILSSPCGATPYDVDIHGEHVSSSAMEPAAANAYLVVAQDTLNGIAQNAEAHRDASEWCRMWLNSRGGLPVGALYVQLDGSTTPHAVDNSHVACDQIPIEEVAEWSLWNVTGGKVGHDVARILVDADFLEPGNQTIAVGAGPTVCTPTVGQIDTANCGGMKVFFTLQGAMEVIYIPSCNNAKYVLFPSLLPISVHCV